MSTDSDTTSIVIPTSREALLQHDGHPVPWVARWDGEISRDGYQVGQGENGPYVLYADGRENREASGILWAREGLTRAGSPEYAQVSTYRQRASMARTLCQVCGAKIRQRPIRWLMDKRQLEYLDDGRAITISPPTCSSCVPLALDICPNFKRSGYVILSVLEYEMWGVEGEAIARGQNGELRQIPGVRVSYETPQLHDKIIARQQVAQLTKFKVVEEHTP